MIAEKVAELVVSSCAMRAKILAVPPFKKKQNTKIHSEGLLMDHKSMNTFISLQL